MIKIKIDVTKLDKSRFFKGAKGTYADLVIYENDQPDEYGNDFSVKQDCSKEDRERREDALHRQRQADWAVEEASAATGTHHAEHSEGATAGAGRRWMDGGQR